MPGECQAFGNLCSKKIRPAFWTLHSEKAQISFVAFREESLGDLRLQTLCCLGDYASGSELAVP